MKGANLICRLNLILLLIHSLLNDSELRVLADKCQNLIADRERIKREKLRQELMGNLQKAIGDILHNGFSLMIENVENPNWAVKFLPDEIYHIEIK